MDRCSDVLQRGFESKELRSFSELYVVVVVFSGQFINMTYILIIGLFVLRVDLINGFKGSIKTIRVIGELLVLSYVHNCLTKQFSAVTLAYLCIYHQAMLLNLC